MSEHNPTNPNAPKAGAAHAARKLSCEEWEALLVDFLDGTLPAAIAESFHSHRETCAGCAEMFAHSGQGREWLNFLRVEPPVPPVLVSKILAQTSGAASVVSPRGELEPVAEVSIPVTPVLPFWKRPWVALGNRLMAQPRLLMTAAMAFFSITLTLNMAGVRLSAIHLADLKPTTLTSNLNKQYYMATARVVRYYDNLRFFYEMEARVRELRRDADLDNSKPAEGQPAPSPAPQDGGHKNGGKSQGPSSQQPRAMLWGEKVEAALGDPLGELRALTNSHEMKRHHSEGSIENTDSRAADQAERGIA